MILAIANIKPLKISSAYITFPSSIIRNHYIPLGIRVFASPTQNLSAASSSFRPTSFDILRFVGLGDGPPKILERAYSP